MALAINEHALPPDDPEIARSLVGLAAFDRFQGLNADAERLYTRLLLIQEEALGPGNPKIGGTLSALAKMYTEQRRFAEAEALFKRLIPLEEKASPPEEFASTLDLFAEFYTGQARYAEAEPHLKRALAIIQGIAKTSDPAGVSNALLSLAQCYRNQRLFGKAERLVQQALSNEEGVFGPNYPGLARLLYSRADIYFDQGRFDESERDDKRALEIQEKAYGPENATVANSLTRLGMAYYRMGFRRGQKNYYRLAEPLLKRSLAIYEKWYSEDHPFVNARRYTLVELYALQDNWQGMVEFLRPIRDSAITRAKHAGEDVGKTPVANAANKSADSFGAHTLLIQAAYRLADSHLRSARELEQEMFLSAQWAHHSETAASLAQMAARHAGDNPTLVRLARDRQNLANEWLEKLVHAFAAPSDRRNASVDPAPRVRMATIDQQLAAIDATLARDFTKYAALANPEPLSIRETQAELHANEALVLFVNTSGHYKFPAETFAWFITKTNSRWLRVDMESKVIADNVQALRCGLDINAWTDSRCSELLGVTYTAADRRALKPLPFDRRRAHDLYRALLGRAEDLIKDKHLIIVPAGPLTTLPFQVLVTARPTSIANYAKTAWLTSRQPITVLPSVASLQALRTRVKESLASRPYIGFGNPLLDGDSRNAVHVQRAKLASRFKDCATVRDGRMLTSTELRGPLKPLRSDTDVGDIRRLLPLPETAEELCAVGRSLNVPDTEIRLGARATKKELKDLSASGELAEYRVIHFATHGTLSGEAGG
jgi:tetratricopeptide (TPR) repeat protein